MRMSADVQVGLFFLQDVLHFGHVVAGIPTDVGHVDINVLDMEKQVPRILHTHDMVIDVAMYSTQGLEIGQGIGGLYIADIARMPQLVNVLEEVEKLWYEGAMRIR